MCIWKITVSGEISGRFTDYHGCADTAKEAMAKGLVLAKKAAKKHKCPPEDELYVSEVVFVAHKDF